VFQPLPLLSYAKSKHFGLGHGRTEGHVCSATSSGDTGSATVEKNQETNQENHIVLNRHYMHRLVQTLTVHHNLVVGRLWRECDP
jgi:hypothetical protein